MNNISKTINHSLIALDRIETAMADLLKRPILIVVEVNMERLEHLGDVPCKSLLKICSSILR
jgi:hypothetical protein